MLLRSAHLRPEFLGSACGGGAAQLSYRRNDVIDGLPRVDDRQLVEGDNMNPDKMFPFFVGTWAVLAVGLFVFYHVSRLETKQRWDPWIQVGIGVLFLGFPAAMLPNIHTLIIVAPGVALIAVLNIKLTKFCPKCGSMLYAHFTTMKFCYKCGAPLRSE
jgi:hypothetical protein